MTPVSVTQIITHLSGGGTQKQQIKHRAGKKLDCSWAFHWLFEFHMKIFGKFPSPNLGQKYDDYRSVPKGLDFRTGRFIRPTKAKKDCC
jgi:hypothetical protein